MEQDKSENVRYSYFDAEQEGQAYTMRVFGELDDFTDITSAFKAGMKRQTELMNKNQWISVNDRLPMPDEDVIALGLKCGRLNRREYMIAWISSDTGKWRTETDKDYDNNPDHFAIHYWMPLPEPPKQNNID